MTKDYDFLGGTCFDIDKLPEEFDIPFLYKESPYTSIR